ncbi:MAG: selenide, water dikinase SelD [Phycisphaerales bacterium]|nr:selenide, water dikinase SelD [Phycisphaerales bacterium]
MAQVLRRLPRTVHPDLLVGTEHFDDAGVFRINAGQALVQTVDFFPPLVNDPYTFGRIAAANSLSDVYAMGGTPITALNIVGFPDQELAYDVLVDILRGGQERATAAGTIIIGGHSVRDAEVKYGMAVTGLIHPDAIVTNAGARPGDCLVLTKPIGTGTLTTAVKNEKLPESDLAEAIDVMIDLNRGAAEAMIAVGVHAATDITGFGLIGHAFEMASASGVTLTIIASAVPLMDHTLRLAREGVLTRAHKSNLAYAGPALDPGATDAALVGILADAQTSGGLLIAVAEDRCDELIRRLKQHATRAAAVVGRVEEFSNSAIVLV